MVHSEGFLRIVTLAKENVNEIDIPTADQRLALNPAALLVDVREDDEWRAGHVKGAIHIGKGVIERDIEKLVPEKGRELLLYCGGGFRSALAADSLKKMGYSNVFSIDGGFHAYQASGREMEVGP